MTAHAPVHPDAVPRRGRAADARHELLDDILEGDEGSSRSQRVIAWLCALLTAAAAFAVWRLL